MTCKSLVSHPLAVERYKAHINHHAARLCCAVSHPRCWHLHMSAMEPLRATSTRGQLPQVARLPSSGPLPRQRHTPKQRCGPQRCVWLPRWSVSRACARPASTGTGCHCCAATPTSSPGMPAKHVAWSGWPCDGHGGGLPGASPPPGVSRGMSRRRGLLPRAQLELGSTDVTAMGQQRRP